jgi:hypothetical protein
MKIRREIASIPLRSAAETWSTFKSLVTGAGSIDAEQFDSAASVMTSLITDEAFKDEPLTLTGAGHRLVTYLHYGHEALETGMGIDTLSWNPAAGDWRLYVPCPEEQFEWVKKTLAARAPRFIVVEPGHEIHDDSSDHADKSAVTINWEALK